MWVVECELHLTKEVWGSTICTAVGGKQCWLPGGACGHSFAHRGRCSPSPDWLHLQLHAHRMAQSMSSSFTYSRRCMAARACRAGGTVWETSDRHLQQSRTTNNGQLQSRKAECWHLHRRPPRSCGSWTPGGAQRWACRASRCSRGAARRTPGVRTKSKPDEWTRARSGQGWLAHDSLSACLPSPLGVGCNCLPAPIPPLQSCRSRPPAALAGMSAWRT